MILNEKFSGWFYLYWFHPFGDFKHQQALATLRHIQHEKTPIHGNWRRFSTWLGKCSPRNAVNFVMIRIQGMYAEYLLVKRIVWHLWIMCSILTLDAWYRPPFFDCLSLSGPYQIRASCLWHCPTHVWNMYYVCATIRCAYLRAHLSIQTSTGQSFKNASPDVSQWSQIQIRRTSWIWTLWKGLFQDKLGCQVDSYGKTTTTHNTSVEDDLDHTLKTKLSDFGWHIFHWTIMIGGTVFLL